MFLVILLACFIFNTTFAKAGENDLGDPVPSDDYKAFYECESNAGDFTIELKYEKFTLVIFEARASFDGDEDCTMEWDVNKDTRVMDDKSTGVCSFVEDSHDPFFIVPASYSINDRIQIAMRGDGDNWFNVTGSQVIEAVDDDIDCWKLENKTTNSILYYAKTNGLLVSANPYNISNDINTWIIEEEDDDDDDDDDDDRSITESIIPGYNPIILLACISLVAVYFIRIRKIHK